MPDNYDDHDDDYEHEFEDCEQCPLCLEDMDETDMSFKPCSCGYQICVWCYHQLVEKLEARCPNCRRDYDASSFDFKPPNPSDLAQKNKKKKMKERLEKQQMSNSRKNLANLRVIQRNLVYVVGLSINSAKEEFLRRHENFGQYGKILKIVINKTNLHSTNIHRVPTLSAYVTFSRREEATLCIQCVDGAILDGKPLRASYGTTKYCSYFLRGITCTNSECMYLHETGNEEDTYTKEEMMTGNWTTLPNTWANLGIAPPNKKKGLPSPPLKPEVKPLASVPLEPRLPPPTGKAWKTLSPNLAPQSTVFSDVPSSCAKNSAPVTPNSVNATFTTTAATSKEGKDCKGNGSILPSTAMWASTKAQNQQSAPKQPDTTVVDKTMSATEGTGASGATNKASQPTNASPNSNPVQETIQSTKSKTKKAATASAESTSADEAVNLDVKASTATEKKASESGTNKNKSKNKVVTDIPLAKEDAKERDKDKLENSHDTKAKIVDTVVSKAEPTKPSKEAENTVATSVATDVIQKAATTSKKKTKKETTKQQQTTNVTKKNSKEDQEERDTEKQQETPELVNKEEGEQQTSPTIAQEGKSKSKAKVENKATTSAKSKTKSTSKSSSPILQGDKSTSTTTQPSETEIIEKNLSDGDISSEVDPQLQSTCVITEDKSGDVTQEVDWGLINSVLGLTDFEDQLVDSIADDLDLTADDGVGLGFGLVNTPSIDNNIQANMDINFLGSSGLLDTKIRQKSRFDFAQDEAIATPTTVSPPSTTSTSTDSVVANTTTNINNLMGINNMIPQVAQPQLPHQDMSEQLKNSFRALLPNVNINFASNSSTLNQDAGHFANNNGISGGIWNNMPTSSTAHVPPNNNTANNMDMFYKHPQQPFGFGFSNPVDATQHPIPQNMGMNMGMGMNTNPNLNPNSWSPSSTLLSILTENNNERNRQVKQGVTRSLFPENNMPNQNTMMGMNMNMNMGLGMGMGMGMMGMGGMSGMNGMNSMSGLGGMQGMQSMWDEYNANMNLNNPIAPQQQLPHQPQTHQIPQQHHLPHQQQTQQQQQQQQQQQPQQQQQQQQPFMEMFGNLSHIASDNSNSNNSMMGGIMNGNNPNNNRFPWVAASSPYNPQLFHQYNFYYQQQQQQHLQNSANHRPVHIGSKQEQQW